MTKKIFFILTLFAFGTLYSQKPISKKATFFRVSPKLSEMVKLGKQQQSQNYAIDKEKNEENEWHPRIINNGLNRPDPLSPIQRNRRSAQSADINKIVDFDGVNNMDGVAPPDTSGDVNANFYMQCVNGHTVIKDRNGNDVVAAFPTSNFWQGTQFANRNDGDAVILWDENAQRWLVTQFYVPQNGDQYLLIAVSKTSDPTGQYYQYGFNYHNNMPDYPKWAIWPDGYYMGANAFRNNSYVGSLVTVFERDKMIQGNPNARQVTFGPDANLWSVFPADADSFPANGTPCPFISDEVSSTNGNNNVYIYHFHVDWNNTNNSTFNRVSNLVVANYGLFNSDTKVPQPGTTQKLDMLQSRVMFRPYFRHFANHESLLMTRTVNDGGTSGVRWYEFRNTGNGWQIYQQGTYNPGDGLWRWMPSIAMNANGDISIAYSVSNGSNKYPSIRTVARFANDPLNQMTTNEIELFTGTHSQTGVSRWGDYAMLSVDPDGSSFWFTTEYSNGGWNWRTRIAHYSLQGQAQCTPPSNQASNFNAGNIGDHQMKISWTRGNGNKVLVVARKDNAVNEDPSSGSSYNANATFGSGDEIGSGNFVVYNGTGTNVVVTGLSVATTYHFAVYEYKTTGPCYKTPGLTGQATTTGTPPCNMCYAYGNTSYQTSTTKVTFNTINNSSAKNTDANGHAYSDYKNISTNVNKGTAYDLKVKVNTDGNYTTKTKVWIDWNHDCDFNDPGEEYDLGQATNVSNGLTSNSPLSVTIPNTAAVGQTLMRVSTKYNAYPTACETGFDGEVEDYTINISEAVADTQAPSAPTNLAANNVTQTTVDLSWTASTDNVGVTGYNVYKDGAFVGSVSGTTAQVTNLTANTNYSFYVKAKDAAGNISAASNTVNVKTLSNAGSCSTTVSDFPYHEGFENTIGVWTQSTADDFDWTVRSGSTPSSNTGPSNAAEGSYYVYVESSSPHYSNKRTILNSPCFDLSNASYATVSFKYHMYGDATKMGSLTLEVSDDNGATWTAVWSKSGNQGNAWYNANVNLDTYAGETIRLRFNGLTGTTWKGDMAVDAFNFDAGAQAACVATTLTLTFDNYPEETSWDIKDGSGNVVYSGGTYGSEPDGSTKVIHMCIDPSCYTFTIKDAYGDGMCCSYGNGSYTFKKDSDGTVLASGGSFQNSESTNFCLNNNGYAATGIAEHHNMVDVYIYPNPVKDIMMIYLKDKKMTSYTILNTLGQVVAKGKLNSDSINVSRLKADVYFIKFNSDKKVITQRFVKQ